LILADFDRVLKYIFAILNKTGVLKMGSRGFFKSIIGVLSLAFLLGVVDSACSSRTDSSEASQKVICSNGKLQTVGIYGGQEVSEDDVLAQGTVFILFKTGKVGSDGDPEMAMCTGSLIDQNIVMTAGHCVPDSQDASQVLVSFASDPICEGHNQGIETAFHSVEKVIRHPDYTLSNSSADSSKSDVALLRFAGQAPAGKKVLKMQFEPVNFTAQSEIRVVGYGRTTDYNVNDEAGILLRTAQIEPILTSSVPERITANNTGSMLYFDQSHGEGACSGDSGGPTLLNLDGNYVIIGVNSEVVTDQKTSTCRDKLRSASVYYQKQWILQSYESLRTENSTGLVN
jgi:secreted trypsin-like serine protease